MTAFVILVFIVAPTVAVLYAISARHRGRVFETRALVPPQSVGMTATAVIGGQRHWHVVGQTEGQTIFRYERKPNAFAALLLLFLFVIPGIVYLLVAGERETLTVTALADNDDETAAVQIATNGVRSKAAARTPLRHLPQPLPPAAPTPSEPPAPAPAPEVGPYGR